MMSHVFNCQKCNNVYHNRILLNSFVEVIGHFSGVLIDLVEA